MNKKDKINIVENFIFDDGAQKLLSNISENIMDFNILEITGMGTQEIKHSNMISWIFGDNEHGLGYYILERFLHLVSHVSNNKDLKHYLYLPLKNRDITIYREKNNIDLLIIDNSNKVVIAIENKVYSAERIHGEDGGQLNKYENIIEKKFSKYKKYYIYLTIGLEDASRDGWLNANYQMITDSIYEIIYSNIEISTKAKIVLESYIDLLKRRGIVINNELKELCEHIWENPKYKEALLILNEYQPDVSNLLSDIRSYLIRNDIDMYDYNSANTDFAVLTENYKKIYSNWNNSYSASAEPDIRFGFYIVKSSIQFWLRLSTTPSESSIKYFSKIKEKLNKQRSKTRINIYAEDIVEDFDRFDIQNKKDEILNKFIEIIETVDNCFKE